MDKGHDRIWLAGRLNREEIPEVVWEALDIRFYRDRQRRSGVTLEEVAAFATRLMSYTDVLEPVAALPETEKQAAERTAEVSPPKLSDYEKERAATLAEYLVSLVLMYTETHGLVSLPRNLDIGRRRKILSEMQDFPEGGLDTTEGKERLGWLPSKVKEDAERLSADLLRYWSVSEIERLILIGEFEPRDPVEVRVDSPVGEHLSYGTITLKVEPWVSTDTVVKFYKYHQMRVLGYRPKRPLSKRNMDIARFVFQQIRSRWFEDMSQDWPSDTPSGTPSWRTLKELWNNRHSEESYEDERLFRRDFYRAAQAVVRPYGSEEELSAVKSDSEREE